ncbi:MAG: ABC transporter permease [Armatimonadota bacterium]
MVNSSKWKQIGFKTLKLLGDARGVAALIAVFLLGAIFSPKAVDGFPIFLKLNTQFDILFEYAEYGILATGMTLVILTGGIDLSVGSVLGFSAVMFSLLTVGYGWSPLAATGVTLLSGACVGFVNGTLVSRFKMQPFVATLAMMVAARGMAKWLSGGIKVQPGAKEWYAVQTGTPEFQSWMTTKLPYIGLQPTTLIFLLVILVMIVVVRYTRFGRYLYAIGGNEEATRLSGIKVQSVKTWAYVICGMMAALGGISNSSRLELGDPEAGFTYELDAVAAVVIGGSSLLGGRGGMLFTLIGVLIVGYINKILSINNVDESVRLMAKGLIIVGAVLIQQRKSD